MGAAAPDGAVARAGGSGGVFSACGWARSGSSAGPCTRRLALVNTHQLRPGAAPHGSCGIDVAAVAGLPDGVVARARQVAGALEGAAAAAAAAATAAEAEAPADATTQPPAKQAKMSVPGDGCAPSHAEWDVTCARTAPGGGSAAWAPQQDTAGMQGQQQSVQDVMCVQDVYYDDDW